MSPIAAGHGAIRAGAAVYAGGHRLRRLPGTVDLLAVHRRAPERYPFLLASLGRGGFDLLLGFPGARLSLDAAGRLRGPVGGPGDDFLGALDRWWLAERTPAGLSPLPFRGGWFVYLGYELAAQIEPRLRLPMDRALPIACAVRVPAAIVADRRSRVTWLVAEAEQADLLEQMHRDVTAGARPTCSMAGDALACGPLVEDPAEAFLAAVERARDHIARGDIYQANLSRGWRTRLLAGGTPAELFERLARANPAPFSALAVLEDWAIISSSPERLLRLRDGWAETRPIAGTRPRDLRSRDGAMRAELIAHPKERAEHIMLVDLERNDLGRICEPGSVEVDQLMVLESYAHVHHIVSNIRGRLAPDCTPAGALRAMFPGGTITGCPKVRCMEIIAELEGRPRGAYTGSLGYLNRDGSGDFNILIRTLVLNGREIAFGAGSGIVADSEPLRELEETRAKARGLVRALDRACGC